jgi:hypothetical protein
LERWYKFRAECAEEEVLRWLEIEKIEYTKKPRPVQLELVEPPRAKKLELRIVHVLVVGKDQGIVKGRHSRFVEIPGRSSRELFRMLARDLCESHGVAWRKSFIEKRSEYELGGILVREDGRGVSVDVMIPEDIRKYFEKDANDE